MITNRTKDDYLVLLEWAKHEEKEIACAGSTVKGAAGRAVHDRRGRPHLITRGGGNMNCYTCLSARPVRTEEPERFVLLRCKIAGDRTAMAFQEEIEKYMTQAEAPDWCPRINHEVQ